MVRHWEIFKKSYSEESLSRVVDSRAQLHFILISMGLIMVFSIREGEDREW